MVDARKCMQEVKEMLKMGFSTQMIMAEVCEVVIKHRNGTKLTNTEKFYAGLRYSEFLAVEDTQEAYALAEIKRQECLKVLGITVKEINEYCYRIAKMY